jgi:hypothetical protein
MADKLQRIFEYRGLLNRAQQRSSALTPDEQQRFERLRQQLPLPVPTLDERDPYTVMPEPLGVEFAHAGGRFVVGTLRNASAGGLAVATPEPPPLGLPLLIHVHDRRNSLAYSFPSRVVSRVLRGTPGFSAEFDGLPSQTRLAAQPSGVWPAVDADEVEAAAARPARRSRPE